MYKVILYKVNGSYILKTEYGKQNLLVDGKRILSFDEGWIGRRPKEIKRIVKKTRVSRYGDLSIEEYEKKRKEFESKGIYDPDTDKYVFPDLNDKYAYEQFLDTHPTVFEEYEDYEPVEIVEYDITGRLDLEPYIVPYRYIGKEPVKDGKILYKYIPNPYKMARKIANELGFVESKYDNLPEGKFWYVPNHSRDTLEFMKINGHYVDYKSLPMFTGVVAGTWNECYAKYKHHYDSIKKLFLIELKRIEEGKNVDLGKVLDFLYDVKKSLSNIEPKSKSYSTYRSLSNKIDKFIDKLIGLEKEEKKDE